MQLLQCQRNARRQGALPVFLCLLLLFSCLLWSFPAYAAPNDSQTYKQTVNLTNPEKHIQGNGYYWNNIEKKLTLNNLSIETYDEYGLKIPSGAIVVLVGTNRISAAFAAIGAQGDVVFEGSGSLVISGGSYGIYGYSNSTEGIVTARFRGGRYTITVQKNAIAMKTGDLEITGGTFELKASESAEGMALLGRNVTVRGCTITANAPIRATARLNLQATNVTLNCAANRAALCSDKQLLELVAVTLRTGEREENADVAEQYAGESYVELQDCADRSGTSILLGKGYPRSADFLILAIALLALTALLVIPKLIKYRKTEKLKARLEAEEAARMEALRAEKKALRAEKKQKNK